MEERTLKLTGVTADKASGPYWPEEIEAFGFDSDASFEEACVLFTFRLSMGDQHTPIHVWFKKSDVPERGWYAHARGLALSMAGLRE